MRRIALLLVATGVAGAALAHDRPQPRGCSAIEVTAPGLERQPRHLLFSARRILDLDFETRFERPVYGEHMLHFKVFTPSGFLYQDLTVPFTWPRPWRRSKHEAEDAEPVRAATGFPPGIPVQQLGDMPGRDERRRGDWRRRDAVRARLPVAGTSITMSTLYGHWTVQAFLDDHARPCSPLRRFTIRAD